MTPPLLTAFALVLGLCVGSFLHTCIQRVPLGRSALWGRSRCDACGAVLSLLELIPILSFLWSRGRCRRCGAGISLSHLWVELAAAGLAVALLWVRGPGLGFLWTFGIGCVLLAVAWVDARHGLIPDVFVAAGLVIALAGAGWAGWPALQGAALGMVLGGGSFALLKRLYRAVRKREGMGAGDVKLAALLGAALGAPGFLLAVVVGSAAGSAVGLWLVVARRARWETPLPFGFFLALAGILALLMKRGL